MDTVYDLIIVGGGPAGSAAAVYAARKRMKTLLVTEDFGGQSVVSADIQNWIGTPHISGEQLATNLKAHVEEYAGDILTIKKGERAQSIAKTENGFTVTTEKATHQSKTILIATGSSHRKLNIPGMAEYEHKGITYCASCDGPLFSDMDVVVIGGGNAAFESAAQLLAYCKSVTLLNRSNEFRADQITIDKLLTHPNFRIIKNIDLIEVRGATMVSAIVYRDKATNETIELPTQGIFVEIGQIPATNFAKNLVTLTEYGNVIIDPRTQKTSTPGVWAAGDCTDVLYHQNNIAAGDAVRALEDIYQALHSAKK